MDEIGLAGLGLRHIPLTVTDGAMANALPFIGIDAGKFQNFPAFGSFTLLLGTVNPDAVDAESVGCEHEIAHDQTAIIDAVAPICLGKHHDDDGSAIERVARGAEDFGIHAADALTDFRIRHHQHLGMLVTHTVGGKLSTFDNLGDLRLGRKAVGVEAANRTARKDVLNGFVCCHC